MVTRSARWALLISLLLTQGCGGSDDDPAEVPKVEPKAEWPTLTCDPLVPSYCGYPFPSNVFTESDATTETGRRVRISDDMLPTPATVDARTLPEPFASRDGFSPGSALLAEFPDATGEGLPGPFDIPASLEPSSPTVVIDAETGEWIPHFSEIDKSFELLDHRSLIIHTAVRLDDARRYIVAIRDLKDGTGAVLPASPAFQALRDGKAHQDTSVAERRALYADIFERLESAGVDPSGLQLAWDFTTASQQNTTERLLHMRDEALEAAGDSGPAFTIVSVDTDYEPTEIAMRVLGTMTVPLYLTAPGPGNALVLGDDGLPEVNSKQPTYEVPFECLIPQSAATTPAKILQYGHGLLGGKDQIEAGHFRTFMNQYGYAMCAVNLIGMSGAEGTSKADAPYIAEVLASGKLHNLSTMFDRLHQGALNNLLLMRMLKNGLSKDPQFSAYLDADQRYYHGISQGGIFGGVYMATTTDVSRGVLGVMGQSYNLLLNRSTDFAPFFIVMRSNYPDGRDQQLLLDLVQMMWDRVEPTGYTKHIDKDPLPNTPSHTVLMRAAVGDHQVTTLGAHVMARAVGAKHLTSGVRDIFQLEAVSGPIEGSAYTEYDFGLPPEPACNLPMQACDDPHGKIRSLPAAEQQLDQFLRTGVAENFCAGGKCSYPDLSGCDPKSPYVDPCTLQ